jgi:hypothetical protein
MAINNTPEAKTANQTNFNGNNLENTPEPEEQPATGLPELGQLKKNPNKLTPAKVLSLQRLIGNQATRRLIQSQKTGVASTVQRLTVLKALSGTPHNLKQETYINYTEKEIPDPKDKDKKITVSVPGAKMNTRRTLVKSGGGPGEVNEVNVYSESLRSGDGSVPITFSVPDAPQYNSTKTVANGRAEALQKAAEYNADVGKKIDQYATTKGLTTRSGIVNDNYKWTRLARDQDRDNINTIDPFFYDILIPYQGPGGENFVLDLLYQHAPSFTGYVEAIYDSGNAATTGMASMYDKSENTAVASTDPNVRNPKFTNVHDNDSRQRNAPNIMGLTSGGAASNFDAYTKIAGEGARWEAVRNHASKLQDNSYFFTQDPSNAEKVIGINFRTLWLSWESVFGKKYGITDADFRAKLTAGKFTYNSARTDVSLAVWDLTSKDYDLDQSASFKEPFLCVTNHGGLQRDSLFCAKKPGKGNRYLCVKRVDLDRNWRTVFGGTYNIANSVVANAILTNQILDTRGGGAQREYGYNQLNGIDYIVG